MMVSLMRFFLFSASYARWLFQPPFASQLFAYMRIGTFLLTTVLVPGIFIGLQANGVAKETDELKELPKAVLRHTPPLFEEWTFEQHDHATIPPGFQADTLGTGRPGEWTIVTQTGAPSRTHVLRQHIPCSSAGCYQLLLNHELRTKYIDLTVGMFLDLGTPTSGAGLVLNAQDSQNFLAVLVYPATNTVKAFEFIDGVSTLLQEQPVFPKRTMWHFMRIHLTSIVSREVVEVSFDNQLIMSLEPRSLKTGNLGLITTGDGIFAFDNLRAVELLTGIPISRPPAY